MLEGIAMLTVLAGMGIYFVKSTDISKDMKERSAQSKAHSQVFNQPTTTAKKYNFAAKMATADLEEKSKQNEISMKINADKLAEVEKQIKRQTMIALQNQKIDELTLIITSLEQEIRENMERTSQIQAQIDLHMRTLIMLKENKIA